MVWVKKQWPSILLVPVMMAVGFDSLTGVAIILLGSQIGCLASTLNPFATGIASATAGVGTGDGIVLRLIFWVTLTALSTWFVYRYADKIQKIRLSHWFIVLAKKI